MSEVEKLYKLAGVNYRVETLDSFPSYEIITPLFTAEKQLEILKRLIFHNRAMLVFLDCVPSLKEYRNDDSFNKHFVKNIGTLWQDLT